MQILFLHLAKELGNFSSQIWDGFLLYKLASISWRLKSINGTIDIIDLFYIESAIDGTRSSSLFLSLSIEMILWCDLESYFDLSLEQAEGSVKRKYVKNTQDFFYFSLSVQFTESTYPMEFQTILRQNTYK